MQNGESTKGSSRGSPGYERHTRRNPAAEADRLLDDLPIVIIIVALSSTLATRCLLRTSGKLIVNLKVRQSEHLVAASCGALFPPAPAKILPNSSGGVRMAAQFAVQDISSDVNTRELP